MDLRSFKIHLPDLHVRVVLGDHRGEHARDLEGEAFTRVLAAAEPLLKNLAKRVGADVRALSVDGVGRVLRLNSNRMPPRPLVLTEEDYADYAAAIAPVARAILGEVRTRGDDLAGTTPSESAYWDHLYRDEDAAWELGRAAPPLVDYFTNHPPKGLRALVVGCGRGHEARMLAEHGALVTAIDISPAAIAAARAATPASLKIDFQVRDLLAPAAADKFDVVVEHTCFCAIETARRDDYVDRVADALGPKGELVGLFYNHGRPGGPPFTVDAAELKQRFARRFAIKKLAVADGSVLGREGQELFGRFVRA